MNPEPHAAEPKPKRAPRGIQPKKQAAKNSVAVKVRRKILVKELLKGTPAKESGIIAGFSPATAASQVSHTIKDPKFQNSLIAEMEKIGINDEEIARQHKILLNGSRYLPARGDEADNPDTPRYIAVPDLQAKAKALEMIHKLTGRYVEKHEVDVKPPITVVIRKFCSRGTPPAEGAPA